MAKSKRPIKKGERAARPAGLPACVAFVLCDNVIVGNDLTPSLIRLLDTVGVPPDANRKIGDRLEVFGVTLFISVRRGDAEASTRLVVQSVDPAGKRDRIGELRYKDVAQPYRGTNTQAPLLVRWRGEGLYWYELATPDGTVIAKLPFRLIVGTRDEVQKRLQQDVDEVRRWMKSQDQEE